MSDPMRGAAAGCTSFKTDIRPKFTDEDVKHMKDQLGMDLSDYDTVKQNADNILGRLQETEPSRLMPPPPRGPWKQEWIDCFKQWMASGMNP